MSTEKDISIRVSNSSMNEPKEPCLNDKPSRKYSSNYESQDKNYRVNNPNQKSSREKTEEDEESQADLEALASLGNEAKRYKDEYGINPSRIIKYRKDANGNVVFLCHEETPEGKRLFYILRAGRKTDDWKKSELDYRKD